MKFTRLLALIMVVGATTIACGDDETTGPSFTLADFVGTWLASSATLTSEILADSSVNLLNPPVTAVRLVVEADSTYVFAGLAGSVPVLADTGDFVVTSNTAFLIIAADGDTLDGTYTLTNNKTTLSVNIPGTDIWIDPTFNPATLAAVFGKQ
ncbi:MAG TPA: hypothetical protein VLC48_08000 [Gemmatimonadota bacterium]|nr:hypothetical protein [Gemmatimonadota bacterium]